jgi:DNA-binding CsgD family transcriptional regulator
VPGPRLVDRHAPPERPDLSIESVESGPVAREVFAQLRPPKVPRAPAPFDVLAPAEIDCMRGYCLGMSRSEIADRMGCTVATVQAHMHRAKQKLRMRRHADLVRAAIGVGFIGVDLPQLRSAMDLLPGRVVRSDHPRFSEWVQGLVNATCDVLEAPRELKLISRPERKAR